MPGIVLDELNHQSMESPRKTGAGITFTVTMRKLKRSKSLQLAKEGLQWYGHLQATSLERINLIPSLPYSYCNRTNFKFLEWRFV